MITEMEMIIFMIYCLDENRNDNIQAGLLVPYKNPYTCLLVLASDKEEVAQVDSSSQNPLRSQLPPRGLVIGKMRSFLAPSFFGKPTPHFASCL